MIPKFRVWDEDNREMYGSQDDIIVTFSEGEVSVADISSASSAYHGIENFELMQSTRLKDCNGVEIYEGDIIRFFSQFEVGDGELELEYDFNGEIVYKLGAYYVDKENLNMLLSTCDPRYTDMEVVGNIYEGKEF